MLESNIEDTPHFLRDLDDQNKIGPQPENLFPVTCDIVGLYPNIPQSEGKQAFEDKISDPTFRPDQRVPTLLLMTLLHYVLTFNIFIFNGIHYIQEWGTSIGTKIAPVYANIFVGWLEEKLLREWGGFMPYMWRRYIDDIIFFWRYSEADLIAFLTYLNSSHNSIKFTAEWRTNGNISSASWDKETKTLIVKIKPIPEGVKNNSVDFLDTTVWVDNNGLIQTDLFVKECSKITYLLPYSCHPGHIS